MIQSFTGKYHFLSNFYLCPITYKGRTYPSAENLFQALKDESRAEEFVSISPKEAKSLGKKVKLREDWDSIRNSVMTAVLELKFEQNPDLAHKLGMTIPHRLVHGNTHRDNYWGHDLNGKVEGENHLGLILMRIRDKYKPKGFPGLSQKQN